MTVTRESREVQLEEMRSKRVPLHEQKRNKLTVSQEPGYVYRFVNDEPGRIDSFKVGGWELDPRVKVQVGDVDIKNNNASLSSGAVVHVGQGRKAFLMRIKKEHYDADQKEKQKELDEQQKALKHKLNSGTDGTYGEVTGL